MSFPPPPQSNQPPQPPQGGGGGFGPPTGGACGPSGFGPRGYGPSTPQAGQPPAGPYGAPAGFGPAGGAGPGGGNGGWQQPSAPPSGGGNGTTVALIIGAGVLVLALVIGGFVWANGGAGGGKQASPGPGTGASATPSATAPTPSDSATPSAPESSTATPTGATAPFYRLRTGDCYDIPPGGNGGNNERASCHAPHDAEVVFVYTLPRGLTSENEIKDKAAALCSVELHDRAAKQPKGTAEGTYVQFPNAEGYKVGIRSVVCSLTGNRSGSKKLTAPLR
ncbi:septum formation family protein [Streptomyces sp. WZ-12]|uniref:septum formation family protein n=1 Tax=Streptomyces sp. WZ-12 TaxID=3030210 RepID=UPI002380D1E2|nr:septum formation family protein [Streptomyces sp. WZ-12]